MSEPLPIVKICRSIVDEDGEEVCSMVDGSLKQKEAIETVYESMLLASVSAL